jgi:hypothetical protein
LARGQFHALCTGILVQVYLYVSHLCSNLYPINLNQLKKVKKN